jgi:hypothetical protein
MVELPQLVSDLESTAHRPRYYHTRLALVPDGQVFQHRQHFLCAGGVSQGFKVDGVLSQARQHGQELLVSRAVC